ncbi:modification methylase SinI, partial [Salmonella enterica subsp. enterica serovar Infantis]
LLELTPQRVRTMCKQGSSDAYQSGRTWLIKSSSVEKLMLVNILSDAQNSYSMLASEPKNKQKALSFFSGAMGLDLGIEQ